MIDGGVWANNPVGLSVVEAISVLGWSRDSLKILSLGCTTEPLNIDWGRSGPGGLSYWTPKIIDLFMHAQSHSSLGTAKLLAGHDNIIRIDPVMPQGRFSLDGTKEISSLKGLGDSEARKALPKLREIFLTNPVEPFDGFYN